MDDLRLGYIIYIQKCEQYELQPLSYKDFLLQLTKEQFSEYHRLGTIQQIKVS